MKRFRAQVDEQRHARTRASFQVAMEAWLRVHEIEETTREGYEAYDRPYNPSAVTHRYSDMCAKLGIDSHLHALRHY